MDVRLFGLFTLRSPLSHIGETNSTVSALAEEPILQPDGETEDVFRYSGNAWRGQLRDLAAGYLLDALGGPTLPVETFHLLFSGGAIGGEQTVNLDRARTLLRLVPPLALLGGGVGNQILPGKLRVGSCYPLCVEAIPVLPEALHARALAAGPYGALTTEQSFSRRDDSKDDRLRPRLVEAPAAGQLALLGETPRTRGEAPPQQMRYTVELLCAGVQLWTAIDALAVSEVELGCLVSALHRFSRSPYLGGKNGTGHGHVALQYELLDLDTGETRPFLAVGDGPCQLAPAAAQAKAAYDGYLRSLYDAYVAERRPELVSLLGAAS